MSDKLPSSDPQNNTLSRRRRFLEKVFESRTKQGDPLDGRDHSSRSRGTSPLPRSGKSPDPKNEPTTVANSAAVPPPDKRNDVQPGAKAVAKDSSRDNDMWKIAEEKLRQDPQKREELEKYDRILEDYFGSKLEPAGTLERRKQFLGFLTSEIEKLNTTDSESQLSRCSNKAKRFFKSAVDCVIASKVIISAAAAPCLPAAVACAGVAALLSFCVQAADQRHLFFDGLNTISGSIRRLAEYEALLSKDDYGQVDEVKISITAACCSIIEFQARAACFLQRNPIESAIRNAFKLDDWDKLLLAMKEAEARVKDCAERKSLNDICNIFSKLDGFEKNIIDKMDEGFSKLAERKEAIDRKRKVRDLLQLLRKNSCSYKDTKNRNRERVIGTCDWFTDHDLFKDWNLPTGSLDKMLGLLYVTANPGCGKSVLSRYLIDQILPDDGRTVCYFFFKDDFEDQKSSLSALCTLLHQLFDLNPDRLTDTILDRCEGRGDKFVESFTDLWETFITAAAHKETVCVLDALDECQDSDRKQLINAITTSQVPGLKFLLTSRPYEYIRREVSLRLKDKMPRIHLQGDRGGAVDEITQEVKLVLDSRIDETADFFCLEDDERKLMREQLESVSNRTYLWITLVFDGLMDSKSGIGKSDIMNLTKKLPQSVDDAYQKLLNKSLNRKNAKRLLHIILAAKEPLSLTEISIALAVEKSENERSCVFVPDRVIPEGRITTSVRDLCGLFVTVVDDKVYLLHQTAREFLICDRIREAAEELAALDSSSYASQHEDGLGSFDWKHSMHPTDSNSVLAETCIAYLHSEFADENSSMFKYSAIYWADHYHQSGGNGRVSVAVAGMARDLCETRTKWTEVRGRNTSIPENGPRLCLASALGLEAVVQMFLQEQDSAGMGIGSEINLKDSFHSQTPISWAAENGHGAVVMLLLKTGKADVDSKDPHGRTPLMYASSGGQEAVVKLVLEMGKSDINLKDNRGRTALIYASWSGYEVVVKLLLEMGKANVNLKDMFGRTPLICASEFGNETVVKLLLEMGKANVNLKDRSGRTPLMSASSGGHEGVVKLLLEIGKADVDLKDNDGWTPLTRASKRGHEGVVKLLQSFSSS